MNTFTSASRVLRGAAPLLALAMIAPSFASAQATRTWVSGVGDDANPCSRTAPCKTLAGAISKTASGGEIDVLDPAGVGALTITKSITINGRGTNAGILNAGTNGIIVNAPANARVTIKNLEINGAGTGMSGIRILEAGLVRIQNVDISNQTVSGIDVAHNGVTGVTRRVQIRTTTVNNIYGDGTAGQPGAGLWVHPSAANINSKLTVHNSSFDDSGRGIFADATTGKAKLTVRDTTLEDNSTGTNGLSTGHGALVNGANATIRFISTSITGNVLGLEAQNGGQLVSFGNNIFTANDGGGTFTSSTPLS